MSHRTPEEREAAMDALEMEFDRLAPGIDELAVRLRRLTAELKAIRKGPADAPH